jgi:KDO2-lipid IV(A) lauroyltransferase
MSRDPTRRIDKTSSHYMVRDRWPTRAVEWVQFALAWSMRWLTWPIGTGTLSGIIGRGGAAVMMALPSSRRRALDNLAMVWPDMPRAERYRIARGAAEQFIRLATEYSRLDWFVPRMELSVDGTEHLTAARTAGKGAILVSAHFGNWEAARMAAKQAGFETGIIYRAFNNRYLDRFTMNLIPVAGSPVLQKGRQGMRDLMRHVADGGAVMILVDQRNSGAPFLDFLGHPAETVTVAADLAHKTGAALIPTRAVRNVAEQRFDVRFEPPVTGDDPMAMMQTVNDRLGAWVEEHPEHWFWYHRRWKTTLRSRGGPTGPKL